MVTGSLHATFHFKIFLVISVSSFLFLFPKAFAADWFSVYGAGVLSGKVSGIGIQNNSVPSSGLPVGFYSNVIQTGSGVGRPSFGSLISSVDKDISATQDAYVINTANTFSILYDIITSDGTHYTSSTLGANCATKLTNGTLLPLGNGATYQIYRTSLSCMNTALAGGGALQYNLTGNGLAVVYVTGSGTLNLQKTLKSSSSSERLLIITQAGISVASYVGDAPAALTIDSSANMQAAIISTAGSYTVVSSGAGDPVLISEGPIVANGDVNVGKNLSGNYPGVFVKQNPLYVVELSKKGYGGFKPNGLMVSKTTWRYEE